VDHVSAAFERSQIDTRKTIQTSIKIFLTGLIMKIARPIVAASRAARYLGVLLCAAALALPIGRAHAQTPFYEASAGEIAGAPGTLIRSEPMAFAPAGAQAYRVFYR
jgi:hypothetical protein